MSIELDHALSTLQGIKEAADSAMRAIEASKAAEQPDDYRPHPDTSLELRINNALHRLNLDRPDIAALKDGESLVRNITGDRWLAALLEDLQSHLKRESVVEGGWISKDLFEMVCEERDALAMKLSKIEGERK